MSVSVNKIHPYAIDKANVFLVIVSALIAHILPVDLLVISYAFLGPAHYLTEISWLHDRKYFAKKKYDYVPLVIITIAALLFIDGFNFLLMVAFFLGISLPFSDKWEYRIIITATLTSIFMILNMFFSVSNYFFLFLPTLIHVLIFTMLFVLVGALKNKSKWGFVTFIAIILGCLSFYFYPFSMFENITTQTKYALDNLPYFAGIYEGFYKLFGIDSSTKLAPQVISFLGFIYTYHYLNWFSKTSVIGWNKISKPRSIALIAIYIFSISVYLYSYNLGLKLLAFLSVLHVVLEFPLNSISVVTIFKNLKFKI